MAGVFPIISVCNPPGVTQIQMFFETSEGVRECMCLRQSRVPGPIQCRVLGDIKITTYNQLVIRILQQFVQ